MRASSTVVGVAGCLALMLSDRALAQGCDVPINEECEGAIVFTSSDLPYSVSDILGCENDIPDKPYWDVFYQFDCLVGGEHTFDMCESEADTYLRIYINGCGFSSGDEFAVADDECPSSPPNADPMITVTLEAGMTYWIELGTWRPDPPWGAPNLPYQFNVVLEPPCDSDIDDNGAVDVDDLTAVILTWGNLGGAGDINGDGIVDVDDLSQVILDWGPCP